MITRQFPNELDANGGVGVRWGWRHALGRGKDFWGGVMKPKISSREKKKRKEEQSVGYDQQQLKPERKTKGRKEGRKKEK